MTARLPRDWMQISVTALPGLAAVIALIFTSLSIRATGAQLQIAEQGQITDRYNAAITNLGSPSADVRLGGIYALQRIMQDSTRDQPTVVAVLCAYVRDRGTAAYAKAHPSAPNTLFTLSPPPADIQAALTVVGTRNTADDGSTTVVDFTAAYLSGAYLSGAQLSHAHLFAANLTRAFLIDVNLSGANINDANLTGAYVTNANLSGATFIDAKLSSAELFGSNLTGANLNGADLSDADIFDAYLTSANLFHAKLSGADLLGSNLTSAYLLSADLVDANLIDVNLSGSNLIGANLTGADLRNANLTGADLFGSNLTGANLTGADLNGANLTSADLTDARGLQTGTPLSPTARTPASSAPKKLRLWLAC